jgi:hypothetical protein
MSMHANQPPPDTLNQLGGVLDLAHGGAGSAAPVDIPFGGNIIEGWNDIGALKDQYAKRWGRVVDIGCTYRFLTAKATGGYWIKIGYVNTAVPKPMRWDRLIGAAPGALVSMQVSPSGDVYFGTVIGANIGTADDVEFSLTYLTAG